MSEQQLRYFIIWSKPFYFGWLLSFPWHGPVLYSAAPAEVLAAFPLVLIFSSFHALTYLLGGLLLKDSAIWYKLMLGSLIVTITVNAALLLPLPWVWPLGMAIIGVCAALYVLGWSVIYTFSTPVTSFLKTMAALIILANLVFVIFNLLAVVLSPNMILIASLIPLVVSLLILRRIPFSPSQVLHRPKVTLPIPRFFLIIISLFIFILFVNGGFMYQVMLPTMDVKIPFSPYYRYTLYILVLLVMYWYGESLQRYFPLYMGVSLLGLAFVSFALLDQTVAGFMMTAGLIEAAFAMLDLFVWVILGSLAFIYGAPFPFFGFATAAMVASILFGSLIGDQLLRIGETHRLVTAAFAAASIFLAFTVMPWLNQQIEQNLSRVLQHEGSNAVLPEGGSLNRLMNYLLPEQQLTPRETEITTLILEGLTNQDIARQLFISKNTVKTHIKKHLH